VCRVQCDSRAEITGILGSNSLYSHLVQSQRAPTKASTCRFRLHEHGTNVICAYYRISKCRYVPSCFVRLFWHGMSTTRIKYVNVILETPIVIRPPELSARQLSDLTLTCKAHAQRGVCRCSASPLSMMPGRCSAGMYAAVCYSSLL
jgi:hypothetical protein